MTNEAIVRLIDADTLRRREEGTLNEDNDNHFDLKYAGACLMRDEVVRVLREKFEYYGKEMEGYKKCNSMVNYYMYYYKYHTIRDLLEIFDQDYQGI